MFLRLQLIFILLAFPKHSGSVLLMIGQYGLWSGFSDVHPSSTSSSEGRLNGNRVWRDSWKS